MTSENPRRPAPVTAVVVLGVLQGILVLGIGALVLLASTEAEVQEALDTDAGAVRVLGFALVLLGAIGCVLAVMLARGSELARSVFGVLNVVHVGASVYALVALRDLAVASVWPLLLAVAVLWCLYGSDTATAYFDR